jgi:hypothetical protein
MIMYNSTKSFSLLISFYLSLGASKRRWRRVNLVMDGISRHYMELVELQRIASHMDGAAMAHSIRKHQHHKRRRSVREGTS